MDKKLIFKFGLIEIKYGPVRIVSEFRKWARDTSLAGLFFTFARPVSQVGG